MDRLHRGGDGIGDVVQLEVEEDRQPDMGEFVHTVMAVGAEEFEPELQAADVRLDLLRQRLGRFQLRDVEREIDRIAQGCSRSSGPASGSGCSGATAGSAAGSAGGGGGATGVTAAVRAAVSSEPMRRWR